LHARLLKLTALFALCGVILLCNAAEVYLTVAFCPTAFTGAGAVVKVTTSGNWSIVGTFTWPTAILGCPALDDPTVTFDSKSGLLYMYFIDETLLTVLDIANAAITLQTTPSDIFFTGYENMAWIQREDILKGVSATVTEDGWCSDGCFQFGSLSTSGNYNSVQNIPFKAMGSYDLRQQTCAPSDSDECLLALDATTGALVSAMWTNWTVYRYGPRLPSGELLCWMEGFDSLCQHPYNNFLFAKVNLAGAKAAPVSCIPQEVTVNMDEWIASFSPDGSLFATGSGNTETGEPQLLIFDSSSGAVMLNSNLPGLASKLETYDGLFLIWSVDWV